MAADKPDLRNLLRLVREGLNYTKTPLAPTFWDSQVNDLAFERPVIRGKNKALATVRLWQTKLRIGRDRIFVGVAREYVGVRWGFVHTVSPDVDAAVGSFVESLRALGQSFPVCRQSLSPPMLGTYLMGDRFFTQGQMWLLDLGVPSNVRRLCD